MAAKTPRDVRRIDLYFWLAIMAVIAAVGVGAIWYLGRATPPLTYAKQPVEIRPAVLRPGEPIMASIVRCNETGGTIAYSFARSASGVDRIGEEVAPAFPLTGGIAVMAPGCDTVDATIGTVPANALPGRYVIRNISVVTNEGRAFYQSWRSTEFEVRTD